MSRYIDRDALLEKIRGRMSYLDRKSDEALENYDGLAMDGYSAGKRAYRDLFHMVENEPYIEKSEIRTDSWLAKALTEMESKLKEERWPEGLRQCSKCGRISMFKTKFCSECGADMREENELG